MELLRLVKLLTLLFLKDDLSKVSQAVEIAQDTMKIAKQSVLIGILSAFY